MTLTEEETQRILSKAQELIQFEKEYDEHYHPLRDEEKYIEESEYWLHEMEHLLKLDPASKKFVDEKLATEVIEELNSKIRRHEHRLENLRNAETHSVVPLVKIGRAHV